LTFRLLFVGDVVGPSGISAVLDLVPKLRVELSLDAVVANAENSAPTGRGITAGSGAALLEVVDFLTLGNHAFDAEGHEEFLEREDRVVRPANFDGNHPGRGWGTFEAGGVTVGVANVLGKVFIDKAKVSAFEAADGAIAELEERGADVVLVDSHAEATGEKQSLGYHLAGRAQAVLGTHTHVPTADASVLPGGTAYASDVGMTGCRESVIGFDREDFLGLFVQNGMGRRRGIHVETRGPVVLNAALVEFDPEGRRAVGIEPVCREWGRNRRIA
jgi:2',3'-cyclic-nucleotide 2'-phosphodiesterase